MQEADTEHASLDFKRIISAVEGYCMLDMWDTAYAELKSVSEAQWNRPEVSKLQLTIYSGQKQWQKAANLAEALVRSGLRDPSVYLTGSYAIRRARSLEKAREFLTSGDSYLRGIAMYHYNLACYDCQLGNLEAAKAGLRQACILDKTFRSIAVEDEDLQPLHEILPTLFRGSGRLRGAGGN